MESESIKLEIENIHIAKVVEESVEIYFGKTLGKGIELASYIPANLPTVRGDPYRLKQVLLNLLSNSIKFTQTGSVTVEVAVVDGCGVPPDEICLNFSVRDTGIGMNNNEVKKLFERFVQADATTKRKFGGTGLGLAISKQIVELMGGTIEVQSSLGVGTEFSFTLKFQKSNNQKNYSENSYPGESLLVQIDSTPTLGFVCKYLEDLKIPHKSCQKGELFSCLDQKKKPFTKIIVDLETVQSSQELMNAVIKLDPKLIIILIPKGKENILYDKANYRTLQKPITLKKLVQSIKFEQKKLSSSPLNLAPSNSVHLRILAVEDNKMNSRLCKITIEKLGHTCDVAFDGQEALNKIIKSKTNGNKPFDIILMDNRLPIMDGMVCTKEIRKMKDFTPIICFSADVYPSDIQAYLEAGMNDFLPKPLIKQTLVEKLEKWGQKHREMFFEEL